VQGDVYIKRRSGQGAAVYEARCAELGLIPCTQVLQQLESSKANMAHCNLGAGGAPALAAALSANSVISSLDLRDNNLDGKVGWVEQTHGQAQLNDPALALQLHPVQTLTSCCCAELTSVGYQLRTVGSPCGFFDVS
jgi:hypothetical protein